MAAAGRRHALRMMGTGLAALGASALAGPRQARAQVGIPDDGPPPDFDPGGRVRVNYDETAVFNELLGYPPMLGRVEARLLRVLENPWQQQYDIAYNVHYADVLPIYQAVHIPESRWSVPHNDVWFDLGDGWIHSSWVVPVKEQFNDPQTNIPLDGFWGEITVPTAWQHWEPKLYSERWYDLAYGAVFRIIDRTDEPNGRAWYRIEDDINPNVEYWVQAAHVRRLHPREFSPISPEVPPDQKRIEIQLADQILTCFEGDRAVFRTRCATGDAWQGPDGRVYNYYTPRGEYHIYHKRPSRHMQGGATSADDYDLPGVPWSMFFQRDGIAIHGTYWHNDYGHRRSHGCVNVTSMPPSGSTAGPRPPCSITSSSTPPPPRKT